MTTITITPAYIQQVGLAWEYDSTSSFSAPTPITTFPITYNQPSGTLYLSSNITITANDQYIKIGAAGITIDGQNNELLGSGSVTGWGGFIGNNNSANADGTSGVGFSDVTVRNIINNSTLGLSTNSGYLIRQNFGRGASISDRRVNNTITNLINNSAVTSTVTETGLAGIIGKGFGEFSTNFQVQYCRNYGDITNGFGIAGECSSQGQVCFVNCINFGDMNDTDTSSYGITNFRWPEGNKVILTNLWNTLLYRCSNYGRIQGSNSAGLCGCYTNPAFVPTSFSQTLLIRECFNSGEIATDVTNNNWKPFVAVPNSNVGANCIAGICTCKLGSAFTSSNQIQNMMLLYCVNTGTITGSGFGSGLICCTQNNIVGPGFGFGPTYDWFRCRTISRLCISVTNLPNKIKQSAVATMLAGFVTSTTASNNQLNFQLSPSNSTLYGKPNFWIESSNTYVVSDSNVIKENFNQYYTPSDFKVSAFTSNTSLNTWNSNSGSSALLSTPPFTSTNDGTPGVSPNTFWNAYIGPPGYTPPNALNWNGNNYNPNISGVPQLDGIFTDISVLGLNNTFTTNVPFVFQSNYLASAPVSIPTFNSYNGLYSYTSGDTINPNNGASAPTGQIVPFGQYNLINSNIENENSVNLNSTFGTINPTTGIITTNFTPGDSAVNLNTQNNKYAIIYQTFTLGDYPNVPLYNIVSFQNNISAVCLHEKTLILISRDGQDVYERITNIRQGDHVKTLNNGYIPVKNVYKGTLYNSANYTDNKKKDKFYFLSKDDYPELIEDLILTGGHPILVKEYPSEQERLEHAKVWPIESERKINEYVRLLTFLNQKSRDFNLEGKFDIYNLVLESENKYKNYEIFANGILTESLSEYYYELFRN